MDLEAQSFLRDKEDVDVQVPWRTQLRKAAVLVIVLRAICSTCRFVTRAEHNRPAAGSLCGFIQQAGQHSETLQLLFPSHAETKIVEVGAPCVVVGSQKGAIGHFC